MPLRPRRAPLPRPRAELSRPWRLWLADNLLRGVPTHDLETALVRNGVAPGLAARTVRSAARAPELEVARRGLAPAGRQALAGRLRRELLALRDPEVERRPTPPPAAFLRDYYATGTPVVLTELVTRWPAFTRWSPQDLRERFGAAPIELEDGRSSDPTPDMNYERHRRTATMAEYVDRVLAAGETNDIYLIANVIGRVWIRPARPHHRLARHGGQLATPDHGSRHTTSTVRERRATAAAPVPVMIARPPVTAARRARRPPGSPR